MNKKIRIFLTSCLLLLGGAGVTLNSSMQTEVVAKVKQIVKYDYRPEHKAKKLEQKNKDTEEDIQDLDQKIAQVRQELKKYSGAHSVESVAANKLAQLNYSGQDVITVNNNDPSFSNSDLSTNQGAWQEYGNLDNLNRVTAANALLNQSLMPTSKRQALNVNPTGWHNKRIAGGWLYNRSHLIGYQLTGQNNNWKNLMTGTRQLNDPDMVRYEDQVADYLKASSSHYVRYRVTPIFRGNELLARGVEMEGQSINSNAVHFNVYIFNVEKGVTLNYNDGTSKVG